MLSSTLTVRFRGFVLRSPSPSVCVCVCVCLCGSGGGGGWWPRQGKEPQENRGGQNQGRRHDHSATETTRDTMQARAPPASTNKECAMCTRDPWSGGVDVVDGRDNAWRSRAPGPYTHGNPARQVGDGLRVEVAGQQKQSNHPATASTTPIRQLLGAVDVQTARPHDCSTHGLGCTQGHAGHICHWCP